ncbi:quinone oxidoreductase [Aestuariivirga sp. YIM B02566]|uniref:Quinone oxidoreductase n=2 Tax=Taklimakanibacter albus TaxID=2800327 RepID=A0ACC5R1F6_9HYPH|nr:quinone oxidoreductase [Aestuariivirga sp. YIM B02566]
MHLVDVDVPSPGKGEIRLRQTAIGLNYIDTYHRSGLYALPLPAGIGMEGAGVIEAVGEGVKGLKVGDRVAYGVGPRGAYARHRNVPASRVAKLPKSISDETAAGMMLKGLTVRALLRSVYKVKRGETILFHAAAGGVGVIFTQWAKALGVKVIGTVGSDDKIAVAKAHGCAHVINYRTDDVVARVKEITKGAGVPVVYDGVGQATFMTSLDCLRPRGLLVCFGNASGPVKSFDLGLLAAKGSLYVTRPTVMTYMADDAELAAASRDLIEIVKSGKVKIPVNQRYKLADVAQAHRDLESRATTGTTILIP